MLCLMCFFSRRAQVDIVAANAEDHRLWFGWIESRMRNLILALDQIEVRRNVFFFFSLFRYLHVI